jgi:hypothetical protein
MLTAHLHADCNQERSRRGFVTGDKGGESDLPAFVLLDSVATTTGVAGWRLWGRCRRCCNGLRRFDR